MLSCCCLIYFHFNLENFLSFLIRKVCNAGDLGSILGLGKSPREGKGYQFQYSGLESYTVHGVAKSKTWLSDFHFTSHKTGLVVTISFNFCLGKSLSLYFKKRVFPDMVFSLGRCFCFVLFRILNVSFLLLLSCKVSDEKSSHRFMSLLLYVKSHSLAAFKILLVFGFGQFDYVSQFEFFVLIIFRCSLDFLM